MKKNFNDIVIIGAGPAAISFLSSFNFENKSVAVINGISNTENVNKHVHSKISYVSFKQGLKPKIAEILFNKNNNEKIYSSASVGGFANYWGRQFIEFLPNDEYPKKYFKKYSDYIAQCKKTISNFTLINLFEEKKKEDNYNIYKPILLIGTRNDPSSLYKAMSNIFNNLKSEIKINEFESRVNTIEIIDDYISLNLFNNKKIFTKEVIFASGVLGNIQIILRSFPEIKNAIFNDHCSEIIYAGNVKKIFNYDTSRSNDLIFGINEKVQKNKSLLYASYYNLNYEDINFLTSHFLGKNFNFFKNIKIPFLNHFINPIQVWTNKVYLLKVDRKYFEYDQNQLKNEDNVADEFKIFLSKKTNIYKTIKIKPGQGFHYHNLKFNIDDKIYSISDLLKIKFKNKALCVDASILENVSARPLTLTAMANAAVQKFS